MMKKVITACLVMSMVAVASAGLKVVIQNDAGGWQEFEKSRFARRHSHWRDIARWQGGNAIGLKHH